MKLSSELIKIAKLLTSSELDKTYRVGDVVEVHYRGKFIKVREFFVFWTFDVLPLDYKYKFEKPMDKDRRNLSAFASKFGTKYFSTQDRLSYNRKAQVQIMVEYDLKFEVLLNRLGFAKE